MHEKRIKKIQSHLENDVGFIVEDTRDLYYLTGKQVSCGTLLLTKKEAFFAVDSRYFDAVSIEAPCTVLQAARGGALDVFLEHISDSCHLGFDPSETLCSRAEAFKKSAGKRKVIELASPVKKMRLVKDAQEIEELRKSARLNQEGMDFLGGLLQEGVSEKELAVELEIFWKRKGASSLSFDPIIAFGENSAKPHHRCSDTTLKIGDPVLFDIGVTLGTYNSDMTRTLFFGKISSFWEKAFAAVLEAQKVALDAARPGVFVEDLDKMARDYLEKEGFGQYFTHSLGHGVGLEIHEAPWVRTFKGGEKTPLEEGMCITIEPGVYFPGKGGIRIEDTIIITSKGSENFYPRKKECVVLQR